MEILLGHCRGWLQVHQRERKLQIFFFFWEKKIIIIIIISRLRGQFLDAYYNLEIKGECECEVVNLLMLKKYFIWIFIRKKKSEILNHGQYSVYSDIFSFGVLLWEIATQNDTPFEGMPAAKIINDITGGKRPEIPQNCPFAFKTLIEKCWHQDPKQRPTATQIIARLENMKFVDTQSGPSAVPIRKADNVYVGNSVSIGEGMSSVFAANQTEFAFSNNTPNVNSVFHFSLGSTATPNWISKAGKTFCLFDWALR